MSTLTPSSIAVLQEQPYKLSACEGVPEPSDAVEEENGIDQHVQQNQAPSHIFLWQNQLSFSNNTSL